jgi:hypothetical protein
MSTDTDYAIRQKIRAEKANRARSQNYHGHEKNVLRSIFPYMKPHQTYTMEDVEVLMVKTGWNFTSAGPVTTFGVRAGLLNRVGKGKYQWTGKPVRD